MEDFIKFYGTDRMRTRNPVLQYSITQLTPQSSGIYFKHAEFEPGIAN